MKVSSNSYARLLPYVNVFFVGYTMFEIWIKLSLVEDVSTSLSSVIESYNSNWFFFIKQLKVLIYLNFLSISIGSPFIFLLYVNILVNDGYILTGYVYGFSPRTYEIYPFKAFIIFSLPPGNKLAFRSLSKISF